MARDSDASTVTKVFALTGGLAFGTSLVFFLFAYLFLYRAAPSASSWQDGLLAVAMNLGMFTVFAAHHSVLARSGAKRVLTTVLPQHLERTSYVTIASLLFLMVCWSWRPVPGTLWDAGVFGTVLLTAIQLGGVGLTIWAASKIDVLELAGVSQALRLPADEAASLTTTGLYAVVRHPIYFAWLLLVWPTPEMSGTRLVFAAASTAYLVLAIPLEERDLERTFGPAYADYRRRVRWRLVPFVF